MNIWPFVKRECYLSQWCFISVKIDKADEHGIPDDVKDTARENDVIIPQLADDMDVRSSSNGIFQNILNNMRKGEVTQDMLDKWMNQLQTAMSRGTISSQAVNRFMATLKEKLSGTTFTDTCCIVGWLEWNPYGILFSW